MINEMSKFDILYLLHKRIEVLKLTTNDINTYCDAVDEDDYKVLFLTSECLLNELNELYNILYNLDIRYCESKDTKIIIKNLIKELVDIDSYSLNFYLIAIEYESLDEFLSEYKNKVEVMVTNLVKCSKALKEIKNEK